MPDFRKEIENYLQIHYPQTEIEDEDTLAGAITIKFNTTEDEMADDIDSIHQGVDRASLLFDELFRALQHPVWVIVYEYFEQPWGDFDPEYVFTQFEPDAFAGFLSSNESRISPLHKTDEKGQELFEKIEFKISVGKSLYRNINIRNILLGIANKQVGFEPFIGQSVYFLNPVDHTGFHMDDNRGFFAWAQEPNPLRGLYKKYNHWIPDYTKEDIELFFEPTGRPE